MKGENTWRQYRKEVSYLINVHSMFFFVPGQDVRFKQIQAGNPRGSEGEGVDKKQCQSMHSEWTIDTIDKPYKPTTNAQPSNEINLL